MTEMKTLTILGNTYEIVDDAARTSAANLESQMKNMSSTSVSYEAQELTDDQKLQARSNIGAVTASEVSDLIPKATTGTIVQADGTITVTLNLTDGDVATSTITMTDGFPTTIDTDGTVLTLTWEGFSTTSTVNEEEVTEVVDEINGEEV